MLVRTERIAKEGRTWNSSGTGKYAFGEFGRKRHPVAKALKYMGESNCRAVKSGELGGIFSRFIEISPKCIAIRGESLHFLADRIAFGNDRGKLRSGGIELDAGVLRFGLSSVKTG